MVFLNNFNIETCWDTGIINNSLLFNGSNSHVFIEHNSNSKLNEILETSPNQMTLSTWVNIPSSIINGSSYDIISNGGDMSITGTYILNVFDINNNGNMYLTSNVITHEPPDVVGTIHNIGLQGSVIINDNKWHHIVETISITSSTCSISLYVDGQLDNSISSSGTIKPGLITHDTEKTFIGSRDGLTNFFRGHIDEFRVYNSILTTNEITQLYNYGNPDLLPKASLLISPNSTSTTNNNSIIVDNNGNLNNLSSRPLPYTILTGELTVIKNSITVTGSNTKFIDELKNGDIILLDEGSNEEYTIINISSDTSLTLDRSGYSGAEANKLYKRVLRKPCIYSFYDNSDSIKGHINNYGNMIIGNTKPSSMLEISGVTGNTNLKPELTITNQTNEDTLNGRKTSLNFRGFNSLNTVNAIPYVNLGHIETSHYQTSADNKGIMKFYINDGTGVAETNVMTLTSNGGILYSPITTITSATVTLDSTHYTVICNVTNNAIQITLPDDSSSGRIYILKKYASAGSSALTIHSNTKELDGTVYNSSSPIYTVSTAFIKLQYDGTAWWIIG